MPVDAVTLLGLMSEPLAMAYLTNACVLDDKSPSALRQIWEAARAQIGSPGPYRTPAVRPVEGFDGHLEEIVKLPRFSTTYGPTPTFQWVEIDGLIAYQFHVALGRSAVHSGDAPDTPQESELCQGLSPRQA